LGGTIDNPVFQPNTILVLRCIGVNLYTLNVVSEPQIVSTSVIVTSDTTASNDTTYTANGIIVFTDPTPADNKGYNVYVLGGTSEIGGVVYNSGAVVYRYYDVLTTSWKTDVLGISVVSLTMSEMSALISAHTVNKQLQYEITDTSEGKIRVFGDSNVKISSVAFKMGYWDGTDYVEGKHGYYNLDTDVFTPLGEIQEAVYYVSGQDDTGLLGLTEKKNNTGVSFTFTRLSTGTFECPEFDPSIHFIADVATTYAGGKAGFSYESYSIDGSKFIETKENLNILSDSVFEFGGVIKIQQYI
jgi:hypothetical protein